MLRIRFFRVGKKNQPLFKIVVTDKKNPPRGGRFVEEVGFWNPLKKERVLKKERIEYWISKGAKPSDSVYNILIQEKILEGAKIPVHKKEKKNKKKEKIETKKEIKPEIEKETKKHKEKKEQKKEEIKEEKSPEPAKEKKLEDNPSSEESSPQENQS